MGFSVYFAKYADIADVRVLYPQGALDGFLSVCV